MSFVLRCFAVLFGLNLLSSMAFAQERVAFLVGNSDYQHATALKNPVRDVDLIAQTLSDLGFKVSRHQDLTRSEIGKELALFLRDNKGADLTLFYFAGHGMQYENQNFLLGVDAKLETEFDITTEALDLQRVLQQLKKSSKASIVFIDACRDNPLADQFYKSNFSETRALMTRGLAPLRSAYNGAMITFSAAPGQVAYDGDENSTFALSLARHLPTENVEVLSLMKRVIRDVKVESNNKQVPTVSNDLTTEIYLKLGSNGLGSSIAYQQEESMFNAAIAIQSPRAWDLYFDKFPNGFFKDLALIEQERLQLASLALKSGINIETASSRQVEQLKKDAAQTSEDKLGLSTDDAKLIQQALNDRGYDAGVVDGAIGRGTRKAIADFQLAVNLPSTGVMTAATAAALDVKLSQSETSNVALVSSTNARRYDPKQVELVEKDQRLIKAAKELEKYDIIYGFHKERLYIAVLTWGMNWENSNKLAQKMGGHLVTLNDAEENRFVYNLFKDDKRFMSFLEDGQQFGPWIGLVQPKGSVEPRGGWKWVTNEPVNFANWSNGQPNNFGGDAMYGHFHTYGSMEPSQDQRPIRWDDGSPNSSVRAFVVEFD